MRGFLTITLVALSTCISWAQSTINRIEYFVDDVPAFGAGQPVSFTPGTNIDETFSVPTSSLSAGIHTISVRVQDQNLTWGIMSSRSFYVSDQNNLVINSIDKMEYFYDGDPGIGNGVDIPITAGLNIDHIASLPTDTLSPGFHLLTLRVRDDEGTWSIAETKSVFVTSQDILVQNTINKVEYFIDQDPGIGQATDVSISPGTSIDHIELANSAALEEGFHTIGWRVRDNDSTWGITQIRPFYVNPTDLTTVNDIIAVEYFIDVDPGFGNGAAVAITAGSDIDITTLLSTDTLTPGFHSFTVRALSSDSSWSILNDRAFYVTFTSATEVAEIVTLEYFIDQDPGIGSGTLIDVVDSVFIDTTIEALTSSLPNGFHTLHIRAMDSDSIWSVHDTRSFFVGGGTEPRDIGHLEYFIGNDPGVGNGIVLDVEDTTYLDTLMTFITDTLDNGAYTIGLRPVLNDTTFGITEYIDFIVSDDSCFSDSIVLTLLYEQTSDSSWTDSTGWLTGPVSTWYGVTLNGCTVESLDLSNNNLVGQIPDILGEFHQIKSLNLSGNHFTDSVGTGILSLDSLVSLDVSNNALTDLADLNLMANLDTINVSGNNFDFDDLENLAGISVIIAEPQAAFSDDTTMSFILPDSLMIGIDTSGTSSTYQWFVDGNPISGANSHELTINPLEVSDSGIYHVEVSNALLPGVTLSSGNFTINVADPNGCETDSLALVELYLATDSANWVNATNWLTGPIATWYGVSTIGCRVDSVDLSGNGLSGIVPEELNDMSQLVCLNLSENAVEAIPEFTSGLDKLNIENNQLTFSSLVPNLDDITDFQYDPQGFFTSDTTILLEEGDSTVLLGAITDTGVVYQWLLDGNPISGANSLNFEIFDAEGLDSGTYILEASVPELPGFVIRSGTFTVQVDVTDITVDIEITNSDPVSYYPFGDLDSLAQLCPDKDISILDSSTLGSISQQGDSLIFVPAEGALGADTIVFTASENCTGSSVNDTVIVEVVNVQPQFFVSNVGLDDGTSIFDLAEDKTLVLDLDDGEKVFDFNLNLDWTTLEIVDSATNATSQSIDPVSRELTVSFASTNFIGQDTIILRICDELGLCSEGLVILDFTFELEIFNLLSPNGDGVNDYFRIRNIHRYPDATIMIFDPWGNYVWEETGYDNDEVKFEGKDKDGNDLPEGTYYFVIHSDNKSLCEQDDGYNEGIKCNGYFVIKR